MDGETLVEAVEGAKRTQLDRLGSGKLLIALTDANLERGPVMVAAAGSEHAAMETFAAWAADEPDDRAREAFEAVADREAEHFERVVEHVEGYTPADAPGPLHAYLRGLEGTVERIAAGMIARPLVSVRSHTQVISFFINEPDEARADLFRELKAETRDVIDDGAALLDVVCSNDDDWSRARDVAEYTVQVAYDDYADSLASMGLNPKPIC